MKLTDRETHENERKENIEVEWKKFFHSTASRGEKLDLIKDVMTLIPYWDKNNFFEQTKEKFL